MSVLLFQSNIETGVPVTVLSHVAECALSNSADSSHAARGRTGGLVPLAAAQKFSGTPLQAPPPPRGWGWTPTAVLCSSGL